MMQLVIELLGEKSKKWTFAQPEIRVGRDPASDLPVPAADFPMVSRDHVLVRIDGNQIYVEDLDSANGTFVNGERSTRSRLNPGDVFKLGIEGPEFRVEIAAKDALPAPPPRRGANAPTMMGSDYRGEETVKPFKPASPMGAAKSPTVSSPPAPAAPHPAPETRQGMGLTDPAAPAPSSAPSSNAAHEGPIETVAGIGLTGVDYPLPPGKQPAPPAVPARDKATIVGGAPVRPPAPPAPNISGNMTIDGPNPRLATENKPPAAPPPAAVKSSLDFAKVEEKKQTAPPVEPPKFEPPVKIWKVEEPRKEEREAPPMSVAPAFPRKSTPPPLGEEFPSGSWQAQAASEVSDEVSEDTPGTTTLSIEEELLLLTPEEEAMLEKKLNAMRNLLFVTIVLVLVLGGVALNQAQELNRNRETLLEMRKDAQNAVSQVAPQLDERLKLFEGNMAKVQVQMDGMDGRISAAGDRMTKRLEGSIPAVIDKYMQQQKLAQAQCAK